MWIFYLECGDEGKGKVVPVLLTEHHAMKLYWEVEV
jgi:adenylosuccinate synthase